MILLAYLMLLLIYAAIIYFGIKYNNKRYGRTSTKKRNVQRN